MKLLEKRLAATRAVSPGSDKRAAAAMAISRVYWRLFQYKSVLIDASDISAGECGPVTNRTYCGSSADSSRSVIPWAWSVATG